MRSVLHALVWDSLRYAGGIQVVLMATCLLPLAIYAMILSVAPRGADADPVMVLLEVSMMPFVMFLLITAACTFHANTTQLATKPISNLSIAAWRMIGGAMLLAVQMGLIVWLYNSIYQVGWPLAGGVLFIVAMWFAAQPFFCLAGKSILGTLVTMIPIALMIAWLFTRYKPIGGTPRDWTSISLSETLQLLAVIVGFAWCTVQCVAMARRGDGLPLPTWIGEWFLKLFNWPLPSLDSGKPFRSASRAMFWYEWRWKGWALSLSMLMLLAIVLPVELLNSLTLESYYRAVCSAYLGTLVPGMIMAVINGFQMESIKISAGREATRLNEVDELGSFLATRPISDAQLAHSNLWVGLASVGLMTGLWLLFVSPAIVISVSQGQAVPFQVTVVSLACLFQWMCISNLTSLVSTGRTLRLGGALIGLAVGFAGLLMLLEWIDNQPFSRLMLQTMLIAFTIGLITCALWAFARALRLGFMTRSGALISLGVATALIAGGCYLLPKLDPNSIAGLVCGGILCVLPWATTPLAMRWNRHR